jgi:hypothetical protein
MEIDAGTPGRLTLRAEGQVQTFPLAGKAAIERKSKVEGGSATTARIDLSDLTPGEFVELRIDSGGRITQARAVVSVERTKVRSAEGNRVVLEDGTSLEIGSTLLFVTAEGKPSPTATVRPGETIVLFRHPETRNIYRIAAEPRAKAQSPARNGKRRGGAASGSRLS